MEGKIRAHPLAELIREITTAGLSGSLRLSRERAKVAIYFESGELVFAASNLRAHRLREVVQRNGLTEAHVNEFPVNASDEELAAARDGYRQIKELDETLFAKDYESL